MIIEESIIYLFLGICIGIFTAALIFVYQNKKRATQIAQKVTEILEEKERYLTDIKQEKDVLKEQFNQLNKEYESIKIQNATLNEKLNIENSIKEKMKIEFENLSRKILEQESERFEKEGIKNMTYLVKPLEEEIKNFYYKIEEESKERFSLSKEIERLRELNTRLSKDASNLTNALKGDSKVQGTWGEMILEKILEESGLQEGREYQKQLSIKNDSNKIYRPDIIVNLPKKRAVIIDSKVSLTAYERYFNANSEDEKQKALNEHMSSIYFHLKELSQKRYQDLPVETLDFVLMFIPVEGAFMAAMKEDNELFLKAQKHNIIIVSPSTLLATLRTIENIWRHEYQNQNAKMIAKKAGDLHDKFVGFLQSMQNIGIQLDKAHNSYDEALKRLSNGKGSLIKRAMELKNMQGVFSQKEVSQNFLEKLEEKESERVIFDEARKIELEKSGS